MTVRDLHENFDLNIARSIQVFDPELCECARSSDTELEVRHNAILQLDGSASYDPDLHVALEPWLGHEVPAA